jgi:hypothetical protein
LADDGAAAVSAVVEPGRQAALELGAWVARATDRPLRLIGATGDERADRRDARRLLADASLIVQRQAGVVPAPTVLVRRGAGAAGIAPEQPPTRFGWSLTVGRR